MNVRVISIGLIDRSPVHPREVFADAVADRASGIVVAHNDLPGASTHTPADVEITRQLKQASEVVGIALLDHIIFNRQPLFQLSRRGEALSLHIYGEPPLLTS